MRDFPQRVDVAVVGAGPAGASTALLLARKGLNVLVIERSAFPRTKACGEYLSAGTVRLLEELGVAQNLQTQAAVLQGIRFWGNGTRARLNFPQPGWSLPRASLDAALLDAAVAAGAVRVRGRAERFTREECGVLVNVRFPNGGIARVLAGVVVGADGAQSLVARDFGLSAPIVGRRRFALGGHYAELRDLDRYVEMFVDGRTYLAVNPFSDTRANVMLIVDEADLHRHSADVGAFFLERAATMCGSRYHFAGAILEGKRIAIGPLAHRARRCIARNVLLAGDAAHFVDPFTGQGVYLALRAGFAAARAVSTGLESGRARRRAWREYERSVAGEISRRKRLSLLVSLIVRAPHLARAAAVLIERDSRAFGPLLAAVTS